MIYQFAKHLLVRAPVKNPADYATELQGFLNDPLFRAALYLATPSFYNSLYRQQFLEVNLSGKELNSLRKYVNRYCYRPTPFGLFASVSLTGWTAISETLQEAPMYFPVISVDMALQNQAAELLRETDLFRESSFECNPSLYRVLNEYRFFRTGLDEKGTQRDFQLQSIAFSKVLKDLITFCSRPQSREEISAHIMLAAGCSSAEAVEYTSFLIDAQLLVSSQRMNISGMDYLTKLAAAMKPNRFQTQLEKQLENLGILRTDINKAKPEVLQGISDGIADLFNHEMEGSSTDGKLNAILYCRTTAHQIGTEDQHKLLEGLAALELLIKTDMPAALSQFIASYQTHFEGRTLTLLQALDPEAGVGYQQPALERGNTLLETLNVGYRQTALEGGSWTEIHSFLMESWLRKQSPDGVIRLDEADLERLKKSRQDIQTLGFSVLFRKIGDQVLIENAGGVNAPALMGRFTVADPAIREAARAMARHLERQNPDIIFAELLHLADPHTDNVNRRESIYHYEIPVSAVSLLPENRQIPLSDLSICIAENKVILFSNQHQKVVIPRLTSAYNHSLNRLPLFLFLADLSYQYGRSSFSLDLRNFFPDLSFYPRIEYRQTILSLATWILSGVQLLPLQQTDAQESISAFVELSAAISLSRYFTLTEGDQELVFDGTKEKDILFFCACVRQKKDVVVKEFPEQKLIRQYNAYLLPDNPLSIPSPQLSGKIKAQPTSLKRKFIPGSEWLYLKIYAPRIGTNRLLLRLLPLLHKRYTNGKITQWFFIRYEDHAPHVRLRLKVATGDISEILVAFKVKLEDRIQQQVIREYQIDVYSRELERYAAGGITETERLFWASSELVMTFLKSKKAVSTYNFALYSVRSIISVFIGDPDEQIRFTLESFQQFLPEFNERPFKVDLDKKYRELSPGIHAALNVDDLALLSGSVKAGVNFKESLLDIARQIGDSHNNSIGYLRSIIHMHFNRIFTDESRKQEMICYYLLHKYLLSVKGRNKNNRTGY